VTEPVFATDGDLLVPSAHARGPWDPRMQHGGAPAALLVRAIEALAPDFQLARMTVDFLGAVPLEPMRVRAEIWRPGRRMQLARATIELADGREMCRAGAVLLQRQDIDDLPDGTQDEPLRPGPDELERTPFAFMSDEGFGVTAMELRFAEGSWDPGPVKVWFRLLLPLVDDEAPSPAMRAAAAADFSNGVSRVLPFDGWLFINTDLMLALHRPPVGEWIGLDARTVLDPSGVGLAISAVHDAGGPVGRAQQTLYLGRR
jgi:hypothetical protein